MGILFLAKNRTIYCMEENFLPSAKDLQKKFYEWFSDPVSADPLLPADIDRSIGDHVPADPPFPTKTYYSHYKKRRRHVYDLQKLPELIIYGFRGAASVGVGVGFPILMMDISYVQWWNENWPEQITVIFLAMVLGFWGGLSIGAIHKLHKKYS